MKSILGVGLALCLGAFGPVQAQTSAPRANPDAPQNAALRSPHDVRPGGPAAGRNSFTMGQARDHIEKAGYTGVTNLTKDKDGLWQGRARKDGKRVHVAMDFQGIIVGQ